MDQALESFIEASKPLSRVKSENINCKFAQTSVFVEDLTWKLNETGTFGKERILKIANS